RGEAIKKDNASDNIIEAQLLIDDKPVEKALLPTSFVKRRHELFWKYDLPEGRHKVKVIGDIKPWDYIYYSPTRH
ncbi:MAG: hypothetical protein ABW036_14255, partial [Flavitalea sp.]